MSGNAGRGKTPRGDLYITVMVDPDPFFHRRGADLFCEITVTAADAALGRDVEMPTLTGKVKVSVPAGAQNGDVLRLRNLGLQKLNAYGKGNLFVALKVELPRSLGKEERIAWERIRSLENLKNYPNVKNFEIKFLMSESYDLASGAICSFWRSKNRELKKSAALLRKIVMQFFLV